MSSKEPTDLLSDRYYLGYLGSIESSQEQIFYNDFVTFGSHIRSKVLNQNLSHCHLSDLA